MAAPTVSATQPEGASYNASTKDYTFSAKDVDIAIDVPEEATMLVYALNEEGITNSTKQLNITDGKAVIPLRDARLGANTTVKVMGYDSEGNAGKVLTLYAKRERAAFELIYSPETAGELGYPTYDAAKGTIEFVDETTPLYVNLPAEAIKVLYTTAEDADPEQYGREMTLTSGTNIANMTITGVGIGGSTVVRMVPVAANGAIGQELKLTFKRVAPPAAPSAPALKWYYSSSKSTTPVTTGLSEVVFTDKARMTFNLDGSPYSGDKLCLMFTELKQDLSNDLNLSTIKQTLGFCEKDLTGDNTKYLELDAAQLLNEGEYNVPSANAVTEGYLYVAAKNNAGVGDITEIKVRLAAPGAPTIKVVDGYLGDYRTEVTFVNNSLMLNINAHSKDAEMTNLLEVMMCPEKNGKWPETPDTGIDWIHVDYSDGNTESGINIDNIFSTGRLFVRAGRKASAASDKVIIYSEPTYIDLKQLSAEAISLENKSDWVSKLGYGENTLVQNAEPWKVVGSYRTSALGSPDYLYLMDTKGNVIKVVGQNLYGQYGNVLTDNKNNWFIKEGGVTGRLHYNEGENYPEIRLSSATEEFRTLLKDMITDNFIKVEPQEVERTTITPAEDFNRYVELRSATWLGGNKVRLADGTEMPVYTRLEAPGFDPSQLNSLETGKMYRICGYIGMVDQISIFPVKPIEQCPGTPNLFAPNPIKGDAGPDGFIGIQAVSPEVTFRVEGNADNKSEFTYTINGGDEIEVVDNKFTVDLSALNDKETMELVVYAHLNGMKSLAPAKVRITKRKAVQVGSIKEYKDIELATPSENIYQITGKVVIEAKTDKYLYVRDFNSDTEAEMDEDEHLRRLLIKNTINPQGWETEFDKNGTAAPLEIGDVITGFAISPTHDRGNLLGNNDGFARTIKFDRHVEISEDNYETIPAAPDIKFSFSNKYRMCMVKLKAVQATRVENTGDNKVEYPYLYTLTLDTPTRMRMDVFVRSGFAEAFADNTGFDLTGIVMLDNDDNNDTQDRGKYAFALMSFEGSDKVAVPQVFIEGEDPVDGDDVVIDYTGTATIKMTAEAKNDKGEALTLTGDQKVTIHYSIDGLDPLKVITSRKEYKEGAEGLELGEGDVVVRAFASVRGMTPSDVVTRRFRKNSRDLQFILDLVKSAKEGEVYRFTGDTKVVAMGGDYMFVVGRVGHYLPIRLDGGWSGKGFNEGDLLTGFTVRFHEDENGNRMAVADEFKSTFASSGPADDKFTHEPDVTDALDIEKHPRRLVTLKGVKALHQAPERGTADWTVVESGDNAQHGMNLSMLGNVTIYERDSEGNLTATDDTEFTDGESYDITGFVMLGTTSRLGAMEIWPMSATHLVRTGAVKASFGKNAEVAEQPNDNGEIEVKFLTGTMVTLTCDTKGAEIYYALGEGKDDLTWYLYQRPFAVANNEYIHAKAIAPNSVESEHTHIVMSLIQTEVATPVDIEVNNSTPGKAVITMKAAEGASIRYWTATDAEKVDFKESTYTGPFALTETDIVYAYAMEAGKDNSPVSHKLVVVVAEEDEEPEPEPVIPQEKMSGKVVITSHIGENGEPVVSIAPADNTLAAGSYEIFYTTDENVTLTPATGTLYTGEFELPGGGLVMAILKEKAKEYAGEVAHLNISAIPSEISGIDSEERDSNVRVEAGNIIAPEGSEVFDLTGRRVNATGLRAGIYIVRIPGGKALKVKVD